MSTYDRSPFAVSGPAQVATLANYYEDAGVPFHAWHVVKGVDPVREARMSAEVLAAGARSLFIDLEPHSGFWRGTPADAVAFGRELRRLQPDAWLVLSVDPRPWVLAQTPVAEFAAFSNEFAPQQYWRTFNTESNRRRYAESGFPVPPEGMSPQFLTWVSHQVLGHYGLPINPTGQGHVDNSAEWYAFIDHAYEWGARLVSVWRYGVANRHVFQILRERPPIQPVVAVQEPLVYVVQPGDTLGKIAAEHGTTVAAIAEANGITDVNFISIGQQLKIPGATVHVTAMQTSQAAPAAAAVAASGQTYTVQAGDTLSGIAARFGTTVSRLVQLNGLSDPNFIRIGQVLVIG
jgi:LysM repeat protein